MRIPYSSLCCSMRRICPQPMCAGSTRCSSRTLPQFVWRVAQELEPFLGLSGRRRLRSAIEDPPSELLSRASNACRVGVHVEVAESVEVGDKPSGYRRLVQLPACGFLDCGESEEELAAVASGRADDAAFIPSIDAGQASVRDHRGEFDPADRTGIPDVLSHTLDREWSRFVNRLQELSWKRVPHTGGVARDVEKPRARHAASPPSIAATCSSPNSSRSECDVCGGSAGSAHQDKWRRAAGVGELF